MEGTLNDPIEFTEEQLHAALHRVGEEARRAAFAAGRPVMVAKNGWLVLQHADGREEIVGAVHPDRRAGTNR